MQEFLIRTIKQIEVRLARLEQDKPYFQGALDALNLVEEEYSKHHAHTQIEHSKSSGQETEAAAEFPKEK